LGEVQFVQVKPDICVANMIGQHDIRWINGIPPIRYEALEQCLGIVYKKAAEEGLTVHMPRIGAELSGGLWGKIEEIIKKTMTVESYVYTLEKQKNKWTTVYE
jgi:O-acetyl-ADP-ribose deacetylase (regulator of RNase III)